MILSFDSLIPHDSEVPPRKPSDISEITTDHQTHAEHAMNPSVGMGKQSSIPTNDEPSYDDYMDEVENMRHRNKGSNSFDIQKVLSHLGLPDYEYVDAQNYDYLLPSHLTYGKDQTVKLHNAKIISCEPKCRLACCSMY